MYYWVLRLIAFGFIILGITILYLGLNNSLSLWAIVSICLAYSIAQIVVTEIKISEFRLRDMS